MPHRTLVQVLAEIPDPRRQCRNLKHPLDTVLASGFIAVLGGSESFVDIAEFVEDHLAVLGEFLDFPNGAPSHDTYRAVLSAVGPEALQEALVGWLLERLPDADLQHVAVDGKTLRATGRNGLRAIQLVSAWATESGLTLGQVAVGADSNEVAAIPELLARLDLAGKIVTIDAAGCQKQNAQQIVAKGGDFLLALKRNQRSLYDAAEAAFERALETDAKALRKATVRETGHGRREERLVAALPAPGWVSQPEPEWAGLASLLMVVRVTFDPKTGAERSARIRYFISSLKPTVKRLALLARKHWRIENGLHWTLDVTFNEDRLKIEDRTAAQNFAMLNRLAVSLVRTDEESKRSLRGRRRGVARNDTYLKRILGFCSV